jgi:pentatricopeptide repeat protein
MFFSISERKFILETYLKTKSYKKVCELFEKLKKMDHKVNIYVNYFQNFVKLVGF